MFAAALGIEILCIMSAEIGQNGGLYVLGFNHLGIVLSYMIGFLLAGFSTFMSILGRFDFREKSNTQIDGGCCSFLDGNSNRGFIFNLVATFSNFKRGVIQFLKYKNNPQMKDIFKSSIIILITAESACILTAETVDLFLYKASLFLAIPISLLAGTLTLTMVESLKKTKNVNAYEKNCQCKNSDLSTSLVSSSFISLSDLKKQDNKIKQ
jgi:hypothetical protein